VLKRRGKRFAVGMFGGGRVVSAAAKLFPAPQFLGLVEGGRSAPSRASRFAAASPPLTALSA